MPRRRGSANRSSSNSSGRSTRRGSSQSVSASTATTTTAKGRGKKKTRGGRGGSSTATAGRRASSGKTGRNNAMTTSSDSASSSSSDEAALRPSRSSRTATKRKRAASPQASTSSAAGTSRRPRDPVTQDKSKREDDGKSAEQKVPLSEPVEQRWEEEAGKYLHKKFKKMATATAVESDESANKASPSSQASQPAHHPPATALPPTMTTQSKPPVSLELKHSALSMLTSVPRPPSQSQEIPRPAPFPSVPAPVHHPPPHAVHISGAAVPAHHQPRSSASAQERLPQPPTHPPQLPELLLCPLCRQAVKSLDSDRHVRAHAHGRPFPCGPCRFAFRVGSSLERHRKSRSHLLRVEKGLDSHALDIVEELGEAARDEMELPVAQSAVLHRQPALSSPPQGVRQLAHPSQAVQLQQQHLQQLRPGGPPMMPLPHSSRLPPPPPSISQHQPAPHALNPVISSHRHPVALNLTPVPPGLTREQPPAGVVRPALPAPGRDPHLIQVGSKETGLPTAPPRHGAPPAGLASLHTPLSLQKPTHLLRLDQQPAASLAPQARSALELTRASLPPAHHHPQQHRPPPSSQPTREADLRRGAFHPGLAAIQATSVPVARPPASAVVSSSLRQAQPVLVQARPQQQAPQPHQLDLRPRLPTTPLPMVRSAGSSAASASNTPPPLQTAPTDLSAKKQPTAAPPTVTAGSTTAETLQQRIDKVISENQAIVETLDPLWPRRYMRQSSKDGEDKAPLRGGRKYSTSTLSSGSSSTTSTVSITSAAAGSPSPATSKPPAEVLAAGQAAAAASLPHHQLPSVPDASVTSANAAVAAAIPKTLVTLQPQTPPTSAGARTAAGGKSGVPLMLVRQKAVQQDEPPPTTIAASPSQSSSSSPLNLSEPTSNLSGPQSVKELWVNSIRKPAFPSSPASKASAVAGNMAQLEDIASNLEGSNKFHPSNPEGSVIKELLIKLKNPDSAAAAAAATAKETSSAQQATIIEIKSSSSPNNDSGRPTHIIYADPAKTASAAPVPIPRGRLISPPLVPLPPASADEIVRCSLCSSSLKGSDLEMHRKYYCNTERDAKGLPLPKKPKLNEGVLSQSQAAMLTTGGSVKPVEASRASASSSQQQPGGLLQIAQPGLHSGGGVVTLNQPSSTSSSKTTTLTSNSLPSSIVSSAAFTIPGVPTPSLSGVLTGIKSTPLFSLPGKRFAPSPSSEATSTTTAAAQVPAVAASSSSDKPVPFVLGIPGPYSQAAAMTSFTPTKSTVTASPSSHTLLEISKPLALSSLPAVVTAASTVGIPTITVSPASTTVGPRDEIKVEIDDAKSPSKKQQQDEEDSKFLRPQSLSLTPGSFRQKKHVMVAAGGATLVSPETPRPRKSYVLTYQNGNAYTQLGLKCSTRVYYCSVFRQQPMYVHHKPRLSMYSNWKVVTKDSHPSGLKPKESLKCYDSVYHDAAHGAFTVAGKKEVMIVAHSSQWKESEKRKKKKRKMEAEGAKEESKGEKSKNQDAAGEKMEEVEPPNRQSTDGEEGEDNYVPPSSPATSSSSGTPARPLEGGYKTNDDDEYTYVRGRGRGRYVCNSCGIRCKKPSMLKKHIRSHSDFRPYTCRHCNFSFKTKGNLTKHMKSKAHHKKCVELGISPVPTTVEEAQGAGERPSGTAIPGDSDSDIDEDDDEDEDDDQYEDAEEDMMETEAAKGLLSLSSKSSAETSSTTTTTSSSNSQQQKLGLTAGRPKPSTFPFVATSSSPPSTSSFPPSRSPGPPSPRPGAPTSKSAPTLGQLYEYAKVSKLLQERQKQPEAPRSSNLGLLATGSNSGEKYYFNAVKSTAAAASSVEIASSTTASLTSLAPTISLHPVSRAAVEQPKSTPLSSAVEKTLAAITAPPAAISQALQSGKIHHLASTEIIPPGGSGAPVPLGQHQALLQQEKSTSSSEDVRKANLPHVPVLPSSLSNQVTRYGSVEILKSPPPPNAVSSQVTIDRVRPDETGTSPSRAPNPLPLNLTSTQPTSPASITPQEPSKPVGSATSPVKGEPSKEAASPSTGNPVVHSIEDSSFAPRNVTMNVKDLPLQITRRKSPLPSSFGSHQPHQQIMPKELNTIAQMKAVANANFANRAAAAAAAAAGAQSSQQSASTTATSRGPHPVVPVLTVSEVPKDGQQPSSTSAVPGPSKKEGGASANPPPPIRMTDKFVCDNCQKTFPNAARLKDHMNIHYMERPYKCKDCSVSFRTQGHLTKHQRSAAHYNKVNINQTFGTPSTSNPRPFKCGECVVKFRIHGHLAKHLRSKMHIMKLECAGKLPIGIYAEMERLGMNFNEIDTSDPESALKSLQAMANSLQQQSKQQQHLQQQQQQQQQQQDTKPVPAVLPSSSVPVVPPPAAAASAAPLPPVSVPAASPVVVAAEVKSEPPETMGPGEVPGALTMRREDLQLHQLIPNGPQQAAATGQVALSRPGEASAAAVNPAPPPPAASFFRNPTIAGITSQGGGRPFFIWAGGQESGSHGSSSSVLHCQQCPQSFPDMKSLQIHIFVDHHAAPPPSTGGGTSSSNHSGGGPATIGGASSASSSSSPARSTATPPVPPPSATGIALAPPPTFHNGELLAAARIVNLQQQQQVQHRHPTPPSPLVVGGSAVRAPALPSVSSSSSHLQQQQPMSSSTTSREGSVASSSEGEESRSFNCDLCGATLPNRASLRQHLLSHAAPRPYVCPECDAGFTAGHQLENHMKMHRH